MKPAWVSGVIVLALAGYFGYYNGIYLPNQKRLRKLQEQLTQQQQTQELRAQLAQSLEQVEQFRKRLPPEPETAWLVREVGKLAEDTGLQLTSIIPQTPRQLSELTHLAVAIEFVTSYHTLGEFISRLESSKAFLRVDELGVARGADETKPAQVRLIISTLYVPPVKL